MWFPTPRQRPDWTAAEKHLCRADPVLGRMIDRVGPCILVPRRDYFPALCQSIVTQQISTAAAATIWARTCRLFPRRRPSPRSLLELDTTALAGAGLSRQKILYLRHIAEAFAARRVPVRSLADLDDEQIIAALTELKGVGRWTAEMFLIFVLNRTDLLPVDDLGLRKGVQVAYRLRSLPAASRLIRLAEPWRPYRSIATWYVWRYGALNGSPGL